MRISRMYKFHINRATVEFLGRWFTFRSASPHPRSSFQHAPQVCLSRFGCYLCFSLQCQHQTTSTQVFFCSKYISLLTIFSVGDIPGNITSVVGDVTEVGGSVIGDITSEAHQVFQTLESKFCVWITPSSTA
jgi:hypothetical protein